MSGRAIQRAALESCDTSPGVAHSKHGGHRDLLYLRLAACSVQPATDTTLQRTTLALLSRIRLSLGQCRASGRLLRFLMSQRHHSVCVFLFLSFLSFSLFRGVETPRAGPDSVVALSHRKSFILTTLPGFGPVSLRAAQSVLAVLRHTSARQISRSISVDIESSSSWAPVSEMRVPIRPADKY